MKANIRKQIEDSLNSAQQEAVLYTDGPSVIIAGAGSGKTRVLTYKIAYLIELGFPAHSILALTFTKKAANEMKSRIMDIVGGDYARYLWSGTFHSIFFKILQREYQAIDFSSNITIYDTQDSKSLVKSIVKEMKLDDKKYSTNRIYSRISRMKNNLITSKKYLSLADYNKDDYHSGIDRFGDIFDKYTNRCRASNAMDFDDILLYTYYLFKDNAEILDKYQNRFSYILVDEYQDTNLVQHRIINMLAQKHNNIAVVGDDAQSIYSFRGANIDNILNFRESFDNCKIFKLEENYRSTQNIVNLANSLIAKNIFQIHKNVFSNLPKGEKIKVFGCFTDKNEAEMVSSEIYEALGRGVELSDMVVLYRNNSQSRVFEDILRSNRIPYKIYGGLSFYSRKEIKDVLAYMRLSMNHFDEESLKRIINYPSRKIGDTTVGKLLDFAHGRGLGAMDVIFDIDRYDISINAGTKTKLKKFGEIISRFTQYFETLDAYMAAEKIISESGIIEHLSEEKDNENICKIDNIREMLSAVNEYCEHKRELGDDNPSLSEFLAEISLLTDMDKEQDENVDRLTLMTMHASKGLEYRYVFIVGVEDNLLPSPMCNTERDIEEERRLLYVAITRAKERCFISYSKTRFMWGNVQYCSPSRFFQDFDMDYIDMDIPIAFSASSYDNSDDSHWDEYDNKLNTSYKKSNRVSFSLEEDSDKRNFKSVRDLQLASNIDDLDIDFDKGDMVEHSKFGLGKVLDLIVDGSNSKARIDFGVNGEKVLLLKYAKLIKK